MDAVVLMILLGATALLLIGALVSLYRYLERKVLFPQLPRLWRGDRNRFLVFGALFPVCAAGFVVYSMLTAAAPAETAQAKPDSPLDAFEQAPAGQPTPDWDSLRPSPEPQIAETMEPTPTEMTPQEQAQFDEGQKPTGPEATAELKQDEAQALAAAKPPEPTPDIPTPTPTPTAEPTQTQTPTPTVTPEPTPAATAKPAEAKPPKGWAVCLASYPDEADARDHAQRLKQKGIEQVYVTSAQVKGGTWYRVCATGYANLAAAKEAMQELMKQGLGDSPFPVRIR